jgi:hypothetical protein
MADFENEIETKRIILDYYKQYKSGKLIVHSESADKFSRKSLTQELSRILNTL